MKNTDFLLFMLFLLQGCGNVKNKNPETSVTNANNVLQDSSSYASTEKDIEETQNLSQGTETKNLTTNNLESKSSPNLLSKNPIVKTTSASEDKEKISSQASQSKEPKVFTKVTLPDKKPEGKPDKPPKIIKIPKDVVSSSLDNANIHQHSLFTKFLSNYVNSTGEVDYVGISKDKDLDKYLIQLSDNTPAQSWTQDQKRAYWINAYNAFTIKKIVINYPIKSLQDLDGGKTWDVKWISLGGKMYSLNNIEYDIIKPLFMDATVHFVLCNGAKSSPPLYNKAYLAGQLSEQLDARTILFINNSKFNQIEQEYATISKIFEWKKSNFVDLIAFINKYSHTKIKAGIKFNFRDFDWRLNQK